MKQSNRKVKFLFTLRIFYTKIHKITVNNQSFKLELSSVYSFYLSSSITYLGLTTILLLFALFHHEVVDINAYFLSDVTREI